MSESHPLRKITWLDSNTSRGWHDPTLQKYAPVEVTTFGFVIAEDDRSVTIASSVVFGENYQVTDSMTIPKACIMSYQEFDL